MKITPEKQTRIFWSAASGIILTGAYDHVGLGFLAWFALGVLLFGLRSASLKEAAALGLLAGFVHYMTLLYWLVPTMHRYGPLPMPLSIGALMLLAVYLAAYFAVFSWLVKRVVRQPVALVVVVPVFWVALEYLQTFLLSGFPWGLLGYSQYKYLHLIQVADIFGVYGVSFFVAAINAALFVLFLYARGLKWQNAPAGRSAAVLCLFLLVAIFSLNTGYGRYKIHETDRVIAEAGQMTIAVVQGNIEQTLKWDEAYVRSIVDGYIRLSEEAMASGPQLVVWPETAMPFYFMQERVQTERVLDAIKRMETWFLVGSPSFHYDRENEDLWLYNSAYLMDPQARMVDVYDKVLLVPFGEYVPFSGWLPFVRRMVQSAGDFKSGEPGKVLAMKDVEKDADLAVQICYEIIFPHLSAEMIKNGGSLIVNITNDAWFGKTAGPWQHFSMAVFRSVENRRALVRSANTGISAFVDPAGRVMERTGLFETATISRSVPIVTGHRSFYTQHTDLLPAACLAVSLLLLLGVAGAGLKRKKYGGKQDERRN